MDTALLRDDALAGAAATAAAAEAAEAADSSGQAASESPPKGRTQRRCWTTCCGQAASESPPKGRTQRCWTTCCIGWKRRTAWAVGAVLGTLALVAALYYIVEAALAPHYPMRTLPAGMVVEGNATVAVSQEELVLQGDLVVTDTASLDVQDAVLTLDLSAGPNMVKVIVRGSGRLTMRNVLVRQRTTACRISNFVFNESAVVSFAAVTRQCNWYTVDDSASYSSTGGNTGLTLLQGFHGAVSIVNEPSVWLELYLTPGQHTLTNVPQKGDPLDSDSGFLAGVLQTNWPGATVTVTNCATQEVDLGVSGAVNLTIVDSPSVSLGWSMGLYPGDPGYGQALTITGLNTRLIADQTWEIGPSAVRMVNSALGKLWGSYWGYTNLHFVDCTLVDVFVMNDAIINVTGSTIDQLGLSNTAQSVLTGVSLSRPQAGVIAVADDAFLTVVSSPQITAATVVVSGSGQVVWA